MHAHMPPYTQPEGAYDSRRLREETIAAAVAHDAKMTDAEREAKLRTAKHYIYHAKLLMDEVFGSSGALPAADESRHAHHPMAAEALRAADESPEDRL